MLQEQPLPPPKPVNASALKQLTGYWDDVLELVHATRGGFVRRYGLDGPLAVSHLRRFSRFTVTIPTYLANRAAGRARRRPRRSPDARRDHRVRGRARPLEGGVAAPRQGAVDRFIPGCESIVAAAAADCTSLENEALRRLSSIQRDIGDLLGRPPPPRELREGYHCLHEEP